MVHTKTEEEKRPFQNAENYTAINQYSSDSPAFQMKSIIGLYTISLPPITVTRVM